MKKILSFFLALGVCLPGVQVMATNEVATPWAYIYLTRTVEDFYGEFEVTLKLVVTENPTTAKLEIYDVQLVDVQSLEDGDVFNEDLYNVGISKDKQSGTAQLDLDVNYHWDNMGTISKTTTVEFEL